MDEQKKFGSNVKLKVVFYYYTFFLFSFVLNKIKIYKSISQASIRCNSIIFIINYNTEKFILWFKLITE